MGWKTAYGVLHWSCSSGLEEMRWILCALDSKMHGHMKLKLKRLKSILVFLSSGSSSASPWKLEFLDVSFFVWITQDAFTLWSKFRDVYFEFRRAHRVFLQRRVSGTGADFPPSFFDYPYNSIPIMGPYLSITTLQYDNRYDSIRYKVYRSEFSIPRHFNANHFLI
jgi:hypothetical protein